MADEATTDDKLATLAKSVDALAKIVEEKSKVESVFKGFGRAPGVIVGESPNSSKGFSVARLAKGMMAGKTGLDPRVDCKNDLEFARRVGSAMGREGFYVPLSAGQLNLDNPDEAKIAKEWSELESARPELDMDLYARIVKDLTAGTATTGGTFVPGPARGELIDLLRQQSLFEQVPGVSSITLPSQGSMEFPTVTSSATTSAYAEAVATSSSTPGTGLLRMEAKGYSGLINLTERFLMFASSMEGDAFARRELAYSSQLKVDRDIIDGAGGTFIKGITTYSGITTHTASTTGSNGNTLEAEDIDILIAKMAESNVPTTGQAVIAIRPKAWAGLKFRQDSAGLPFFVAAATAYGGSSTILQYAGYKVVMTNQVSNTRLKGSGTDLTFVLAFVPSEIVIGRVGAMEMKMTDSDGTNFQAGTVTLRGTQFVDAIPKHVESVGLIDELLNS